MGENTTIQQNLRNYTFDAVIRKENKKNIEERYYDDISHVNLWIDKTGKPKYRIYMRNGEVLFLADDKFYREYCPCGVNVINEVVKEKYLCTK